MRRSSYAKNFENQRELLAGTDTDDRDRDAVRTLFGRRDAYEEVDTGTLDSDMNRLRLYAERVAVPPAETDREDVDDVLRTS